MFYKYDFLFTAWWRLQTSFLSNAFLTHHQLSEVIVGRIQNRKRVYKIATKEHTLLTVTTIHRVLAGESTACH